MEQADRAQTKLSYEHEDVGFQSCEDLKPSNAKKQKRPSSFVMPLTSNCQTRVDAGLNLSSLLRMFGAAGRKHCLGLSLYA